MWQEQIENKENNSNNINSVKWSWGGRANGAVEKRS